MSELTARAPLSEVVYSTEERQAGLELSCSFIDKRVQDFAFVRVPETGAVSSAARPVGPGSPETWRESAATGACRTADGVMTGERASRDQRHELRQTPLSSLSVVKAGRSCGGWRCIYCRRE